MHGLLVYETSRSGSVDVVPGDYDNLHVITGAPILTAFAQSRSPDFTFAIPNRKGGVFKFDSADMKGELFRSIEFVSDAGIIVATVALVTPFTEGLETPMELDFSQIVKIGHRGSGSNLVVREFGENTVPGFEAAKARGADYVEFDIQLTSDGIPVIHHDFYIHLDHKHAGIGEPINEEPAGTFNYAIQQFSKEQFVDHGLDKPWKVKLPTFEQLMTELPSSVRFDVEIKYPFHKKFHDVPFAERNAFLNRILEDMEKFGKDRKLFFSSFDIYIVMMLCIKQHKWPVFQLMTVEDGEDVDIFVNKSLAVAPMLKAMGVKGYVLNAIFMLKHEQMVQQLRDMGFLVFTYGDPNNTTEGVHHELDIGIGGICTDKMQELQVTLDAYAQKQRTAA